MLDAVGGTSLSSVTNLVAGHEATRIRANRSARKVREVAQRIFSHQPKTVPTMRPPWMNGSEYKINGSE